MRAWSDMYTSHGHPVQGTFLSICEKPKSVVRCGGPGACFQCKTEVAKAMRAGFAMPHFGNTLQDGARAKVYTYVKERLEGTATHITFGVDEVYVVWFAKTLQNWKALISTTLPDGMYYEVTYSGDKHETYIDVYKKFDNVCIEDESKGAVKFGGHLTRGAQR